MTQSAKSSSNMICISNSKLRVGVAAFPLLYAAVAFAQQPPIPPQENAVDVGPSVVETNPAVRAALELPRETPADYFQAIVWLLDLERPELAKPVLEQLAKMPLNDAQRAELVAEFGSRDMLLLARSKELAPEGAAFADACLAAAAAAANDPQRIAALVSQLTDPSAAVRQMARTDLAAAGQGGVNATLEALAKEADPDRRRALLVAAGTMQPMVVQPLLAMLETNDAVLKAEIIELLEHLKVPQAVPLLPASFDATERALTTALANYRAGTPPFAADENGQVELWHWDDATKKLTSSRYSSESARIVWMAYLARHLAMFRPDDARVQREALVLSLEASQFGPVAAPSDLAVRLSGGDVHRLNEALAEALRLGFAHAAILTIDALVKQGDYGLFYSPDAQPSPLVNALGSSDRRVRFAALRAIMTLDPPAPYPGSSRVPKALRWFASSAGERQALVAMPTLAASANLAGRLSAHDLQAEITNRGQDAIDMARGMADLELIVLDMDILAPGIRQVLYELRLSPSTAGVPVALTAADGRLGAAQRLAGEHTRVIAVSRPHSDEVVARMVEGLATAAGRDVVTPEERSRQAAEAASWLEKLAETRSFYDIRRARVESAPDVDRSATLPTP